MNKETYEAFKRIIEQAKKDIQFSQQNYKDIERIDGWIEEVAKEYNEDKQDICRGCGELLLDGQSIILGEKRHSACS